MEIYAGPTEFVILQVVDLLEENRGMWIKPQRNSAEHSDESSEESPEALEADSSDDFEWVHHLYITNSVWPA